MATVSKQKKTPEQVRERVLAALQRGELVTLLAEVDAGRLDFSDFEAAIEQHEKKQWFRLLLAAALGKRLH
jgi:hypothetical protein